MYHRLSVRENKTVLFLAALLVLIVAAAIGQSGWTEGLDVLIYVGFGAVMIGVLVSRSLLPGLISHLFSALIGLAWSFWTVSQLLPDEYTVTQRWFTMRNNVFDWYQKAQAGEIIYNNLVFILQMAFIIWLLGYLTIWFLFRAGKIWGAIVPCGIVLLINLYYAPNDLTSWFISYLLLALLLLVRFNLFEYEQRWRLENIHFRSDISFDFLRNGLVFSVIIIALAWFTPAVSAEGATTIFNRFDRQWRGIQTEWNRLFAGLNYKPQGTANPNAYAQTHALGGSRLLTEHLVMSVKAPDGRYWRAAVYDEYDGNTWQSNDQETVPFTPDTVGVSLPQYEAREAFTQTYTTLQEGLFILYTMANPVKIDRSTVAKTNLLAAPQVANVPQWSGTSSPWGEELTYIESDARLKYGETYQVVSMRSYATKDMLREDSIDYPQWIRDRYIHIPETTTPRVLALAQEITQGRDTVYDKAEAIERYMRDQITYNERISAPPPGRDKVDYILFEAKEAYCDYYATSMIVMLRALGVPARFAAGYAQGQSESLEGEGFQEEVYMVRNLDAHSWVEVYFPTYGWIEFEPTAAQPAIIRRSEALAPFQNPGPLGANPEDELFDPLNDIIEDEMPQLGEIPQITEPTYNVNIPFIGAIEASQTAVNWVFGSLLVLVIGFIGYRVSRDISLGQQDEFISRDVYLSMLKLARWLGVAKAPSQTPYEHAEILTQKLPPIEKEVNFITDEYVRNEFSPRSSTEANKSRVLTNWEKIRPKLYRAVFDRGLSKIRLPFKW